MGSPVKDDPSMAGVRCRNADGKLKQKRGDTHLKTLESTYGEISDRRADTHLETIREATGQSLKKLVHSENEVTHKPGLSGRERNQDGTLRRKRGDTHLGTLEEKYGEISDRRSDTHLKTLEKDCGADSLSGVLRNRNSHTAPKTLLMED